MDLDNKWQGKFSTLNKKLDRLAELLTAAKTNDTLDTGTSGARRPLVTTVTSIAHDADAISLQPGHAFHLGVTWV